MSCNKKITTIEYYHQGHVYDNSLKKETKIISAEELKFLAQTLGIKKPIDPNSNYVFISHGQQSYQRKTHNIIAIKLSNNKVIHIETEPIRTKEYPVASPVMNTPYQIIRIPN